MITYLELNRLIFDQLKTITSISGQPVFVGYGVPEAIIVDEATIPAITYLLVDDENDSSRKGSSDPGYAEQVDGTFKAEYPADPVNLFYQVDIYSHFSQEMLHLTQQLFARLRRQRGRLIHTDGLELPYELTDFRQLDRDVASQRLYRHALTYRIEAWLENPENADAPTFGPVEYVKKDLYWNVGVPPPEDPGEPDDEVWTEEEYLGA